jgi:hypothetical protein
MSHCSADIVISVCALKDIETWAVAAKSIAHFIESKSFVLVVPAKDMEAFAD